MNEAVMSEAEQLKETLTRRSAGVPCIFTSRINCVSL